MIIEEGSYGGVFSRLEKLGINIKGIPVEDDGMNVNLLSECLEELKAINIVPRYIYTIPTIQNPTGTIMSKAKRIKLIDLAKKYDIPIFEDDCYADLIWGEERPPSIRALDDSKRVIYCGSFSKSIAPGFRLGYLVADWPILSRILPYKTDAGTGGLEQMVLSEFCKNHFFDHLTKLNQKLKSKAITMCEALDKYFGNSVEYKKPIGGIYVWIKLPDGVDTSKLYNIALQGVAINPGVEWSMDKNNKQKMRLCFAKPTDKAIDEGVKKLAEVCKNEFGVPASIVISINWERLFCFYTTQCKISFNRSNPFNFS